MFIRRLKVEKNLFYDIEAIKEITSTPSVDCREMGWTIASSMRWTSYNGLYLPSIVTLLILSHAVLGVVVLALLCVFLVDIINTNSIETGDSYALVATVDNEDAIITLIAGLNSVESPPFTIDAGIVDVAAVLGSRHIRLYLCLLKCSWFTCTFWLFPFDTRLRCARIGLRSSVYRCAVSGCFQVNNFENNK